MNCLFQWLSYTLALFSLALFQHHFTSWWHVFLRNIVLQTARTGTNYSYIRDTFGYDPFSHDHGRILIIYLTFSGMVFLVSPHWSSSLRETKLVKIMMVAGTWMTLSSSLTRSVAPAGIQRDNLLQRLVKLSKCIFGIRLDEHVNWCILFIASVGWACGKLESSCEGVYQCCRWQAERSPFQNWRGCC